jgi:hypothetical protein
VCKHSWEIPIASKIKLSLRKPNFSYEILVSNLSFIWFAIILEINSYTKSHSGMGLESLKVYG